MTRENMKQHVCRTCGRPVEIYFLPNDEHWAVCAHCRLKENLGPPPTGEHCPTFTPEEYARNVIVLDACREVEAVARIGEPIAAPGAPGPVSYKECLQIVLSLRDGVIAEFVDAVQQSCRGELELLAQDEQRMAAMTLADISQFVVTTILKAAGSIRTLNLNKPCDDRIPF